MDNNECPFSPLTKSNCVPCQGGVEPLAGEAIKALFEQLSPGWTVVDNRRLEKEYKFKNFAQGLDFVNKIGSLAQIQGHHPDVYLTWGRVKLIIWTHKINGLHKNDFIFASKADEMLVSG